MLLMNCDTRYRISNRRSEPIELRRRITWAKWSSTQLRGVDLDVYPGEFVAGPIGRRVTGLLLGYIDFREVLDSTVPVFLR